MLIFLSACMSPWEPWPPHTRTPTNIEDVGGELGARWVDVHVRDESTFALQDDGTLWGWGRNDSGELGIGTTTEWNEFIIRPVQILDDVAEFFIAPNASHGMAIRGDGSLWGWGRNSDGQLGIGTRDEQLSPVWIMDDVATVFFSGSRTMVIRTDDSLWGWGENASLRLGNDALENSKLSPVWIMDDVATISFTYSFVMALQTDGSLWSWGRNDRGQLGIGTTEDQSNPVWIMGDVVSVSVTSFPRIAMAITADGSLWGWGRNDNGQLGLGEGLMYDQLSPMWIMDDVAAISRSGHTMVIRTDGSLWGWGQNNFGQLGIGTIALRDYNQMGEEEQEEVHAAGEAIWDLATPTWIMDDVATIFTNARQTIAITSDDSLWGWGENNWGQLGLGEDIRGDQSSPALIMNDVADVYLGWERDHMILTIDGSLWRLGGRGSVWIMDDVAEFFENSAGYGSFALKNDGSLWFWGSNWIAQEGEYADDISVVIERGSIWIPIIIFLAIFFIAPIAFVIFLISRIRRSDRKVGTKVRTPWWFGFTAIFFSFIPLLIVGIKLKNWLWIGLGILQLISWIFGLDNEIILSMVSLSIIGLPIYILTVVRKKYLAVLEAEEEAMRDSLEPLDSEHSLKK